MDASKYVICQDTNDYDHVILLPSWQSHSEGYTSYALGTAGPCTLIAAGFFRPYVSIETDGETVRIDCWGTSVSLHVKSRGTQDEKLIRRFLGIR